LEGEKREVQKKERDAIGPARIVRAPSDHEQKKQRTEASYEEIKKFSRTLKKIGRGGRNVGTRASIKRKTLQKNRVAAEVSWGLCRGKD